MMEEPYTEISFGRTIKNMKGEIIKKNKYAIFHWTFNQIRRFDPFIKTEVTLDYLKGYLDGSLLEKQIKEIYIYNGISSKVREGFFPKCEFSPLNKRELEKLVSENSKLSIEIIKNIV
jgi:hypothetical protein